MLLFARRYGSVGYRVAGAANAFVAILTSMKNGKARLLRRSSNVLLLQHEEP